MLDLTSSLSCLFGSPNSSYECAPVVRPDDENCFFHSIDRCKVESSGGNLGDPIRPAALAEPDLERYTIRLPAQVIGDVGGVNEWMMRGTGKSVASSGARRAQLIERR